MGTVPDFSRGIGVLGATTGSSNLSTGETGVMGVSNSFGVVGQSLIGVLREQDGELVSGTGVVGRSDDGIGVRGTAVSGFGIIGESTERAGVTGVSVTGVGLDARSQQSHAIQGTAQQGVGVLAESTNNSGVLGISRNGSGVQGTTEQGLAGVHGHSQTRYGVFGESAQSVGILGISSTNAVQGRSTGSGGASIGVAGSCDAGAGVQGSSNSGIGVAGVSATGWAGYFAGKVFIQGGFYVAGPKAAAVPHPDGSFRSLYCVESTDSVFEDFGEVALSGPSVSVALDKDFAALVRRDKYHVFLTAYGPDVLYVRKRTKDAFEIARVDEKKQRVVRVGYRIVARRADIRAARLPAVNIPAQAAGVIEPTAATRKRQPRRRLESLPSPQVDRLPRTPELPKIDLKALGQTNRTARRKRTSRDARRKTRARRG
jgi:hypothetical protein